MNDRLLELIDGVLEERLSESDRAELSELLRVSAAAREVYWEVIQQDVLLQDLVRESAGRDLARMSLGEAGTDEVLLGSDDRLPPDRDGKLTLRGFLASGLVLALALLLLSGVLFHAWNPWASEKSGESVAAIRSLRGDVRLVGERATVKASSGHPFAAGDAVQVGEGSDAEVVLADGSRVLLSADTQLRFEVAQGVPRRLHLERGSAEVEAAPQSPDRPLIFTTGQARLTVLGTRFRLYAGGDDSRVELEEGKVRFERQADGQAVEVAAGQFAVASGTVEPQQPLVAQPLKTEWRLRQTLLRGGRRVVFTHGDTRLATADGSQIKVWNAETGKLECELSRTGRFDSLAFTPANDAIVAVNEHGRAIYWPVGESVARQAELKPEAGALRRCSVSRDGRWIAQTTDVSAGHLPIWHVDETGNFAPSRSIPMKAGAVTIAAPESGAQVVASAWNGATWKWDAHAGREMARFQFELQLHVMELSDNGRWLGGFGNKAGLVLVDTHAREQRVLWPAGSAQVTYVRFSRDGRQLLAAMADGVVRAWATDDFQAQFVLTTGDSRAESLDLSDDGQWLAIAGDAGRVTVWQLEAEVRK